MNKKILVLGATGMAGHIIALYLNENGFNVETLTRRQVNLDSISNFIWDGNFDILKEKITSNKYLAIINCIGILNKDCNLNPHEAILFNSYLPHFLIATTSNMDTKIIHLSTDCVFSGKKGNYIESDVPDGETLYDKTKAMGEFISKKDVVLRNSIIGPDMNVNGPGLFNWFMSNHNVVNGFDNWIWSGITTLELSKKIKVILENDINGLIHLTNNVKISKYDLLCLIKKVFNLNIKIINKILLEKIDKSLLQTTTNELLKIPSYETMLMELYDWIINHKNIYRYEV